METSRGQKRGLPCTFYADEEFLKKVEALAAKIGISRSQMLRNLAMSGYEDARLLDALGLLALVGKIEALRKGVSIETTATQTA